MHELSPAACTSSPAEAWADRWCLTEHVHPHREPMNVVLMAGAQHSYWLAEGQHHGLAMTQVNRMLLINNCDDRAMRYYDLLSPAAAARRHSACAVRQESVTTTPKRFAIAT